MSINRIPGFAICAHCGGRLKLDGCRTCGLLVCAHCRSSNQCSLCLRERQEQLRRLQRREQLGRLGRGAAVLGSVALGTLAATGMALLPELGRPPAPPHATWVARGEVRFVGDAVEQWMEDHAGHCPAALHLLSDRGYLGAPAIDPWGEPLLLGCVDSPRSIVILSKGADREVGTTDDVSYLSP